MPREVVVEGTGAPAFTNTTTNTQYVRWQNAQYDAYRLTFSYYDSASRRS